MCIVNGNRRRILIEEIRYAVLITRFSYNYFIAALSTRNFKLTQETSYGHVSTLAMEQGLYHIYSC